MGAREHLDGRGLSVPRRESWTLSGYLPVRGTPRGIRRLEGRGRVNYLKDSANSGGSAGRRRGNFQPGDLPKYGAIGVGYVVLVKPLDRAALFRNAAYAVYRVRD